VADRTRETDGADGELSSSANAIYRPPPGTAIAADASLAVKIGRMDVDVDLTAASDTALDSLAAIARAIDARIVAAGGGAG
jgi:hypothetical protein